MVLAWLLAMLAVPSGASAAEEQGAAGTVPAHSWQGPATAAAEAAAEQAAKDAVVPPLPKPAQRPAAAPPAPDKPAADKPAQKDAAPEKTPPAEKADAKSAPAKDKPKKKALTAKQLFGTVKEAAPLAARAVGWYAKGCLAGGKPIAIDGPGWQVMRLSRNRNWGHPELVALVERLARESTKAKEWSASTPTSG